MSLVYMLNYIVAGQFKQFSVDIGNHIQVAHMYLGQRCRYILSIPFASLDSTLVM